MRVFGTHRELRRANNRMLGRFFAAMAIVTIFFALIVAGRYLLGWW
jgi:hypothetical protein